MIDVIEKKNRIISYIRGVGPSIPVRIATSVGIEPFLSSALMSELYNERKVKMSFMRIGSSPLYFLEGQEKQLENFADSLNHAERDAFHRLKEKKVLKDENETPAIRVALRSIKDFAIPFQFNGNGYWRYAFVSEEEIRDMVEERRERPKIVTEIKLEETKPQKEEIKQEPKVEVKQLETKIVEKKPKQKQERISQRIQTALPIANSNSTKQPLTSLMLKEEKSEFYNEVIGFLKEKQIDLLEDIQSDKKEVVAKVKINSPLWSTNYLLVAKDKKAITPEEISSNLQRATYSKMPLLVILRKKQSKKIQALFDENDLLKLLVMP